MTTRILMLTLPGLLTFALGAVILGLRYLEGVPIPAPVVFLASVCALLGAYLLFRAGALARSRSVVAFTRAGIVAAGVFSISFFALLSVSVLHFTNPERRNVFYTGAALLVIVSVLVARLLERLGFPV